MLRMFVAVSALLFFVSCNSGTEKKDAVFVEEGEASWYGPGLEGNQTANGEAFDMNALTAAHPSLPFGTKVRVTNLENGKSVVVRINDRGPYAKDRVIDLTKAAAEKIDILDSGVAEVRIERLKEEGKE